MSPFEHFVLTKFNVVRERNPVDKAGKPVRTVEWLEHRFDLFERFCLPSVRSQTNIEFTWLITFDEQTPPVYLERLRAHERAFDILVLVPGRRAFRNVIPERLSRRTRWLLTTRFDSDDALHREAVALIQASCRDLRELTFLNLRYGYAYAHPEGRAVPIQPALSNVLSLLEPVTGDLPRTAVSVDLSYPIDNAPVRQIGEEPMWLRVIHERNVANTMPASGEPADVDLEALFGVRVT
jgi:Putative rhamnosyl transferase